MTAPLRRDCGRCRAVAAAFRCEVPDVSEPPLLHRRDDALLHLVFNRPAAANTFDGSLRDAYLAALAAAASSSDTAAVLLTGQGDRLFSGGIDLKNPEGLTPADLAIRRRATLLDMLRATLAFPKPLVVALNGRAIGGATLISLEADRIVAAPQATLVLPEIDLGMASFVAASIVEEAGGRAFAHDIVLSGREVTAAEAAHRGLATLAEPGRLLETAAAAARQLAAKPPAAFADLKRWFNARRLQALEAAVGEAERRQAAGPPDETSGVVERLFGR